MRFAGVTDSLAFRDVVRAHVLAWHRELELRALGGATIRRKLAALLAVRIAVRSQRYPGHPCGRCQAAKERKHRR